MTSCGIEDVLARWILEVGGHPAKRQSSSHYESRPHGVRRRRIAQ